MEVFEDIRQEGVLVFPQVNPHYAKDFLPSLKFLKVGAGYPLSTQGLYKVLW